MAVIEYQLKFPVDGEKGRITVLRIRRPTFRDIKALGVLKKDMPEDALMEMMEKFICRLSGLSPEDANQLDLADFIPLTETITGFFPETP